MKSAPRFLINKFLTSQATCTHLSTFSCAFAGTGCSSRSPSSCASSSYLSYGEQTLGASLMDSDDPTQSSYEKARILFSRSSEKDKIMLEEFQSIMQIGRGTFGRVYLVYLA